MQYAEGMQRLSESLSSYELCHAAAWHEHNLNAGDIMSNLILTDVADSILRIQINRPDKKNALTAAMYGEMAAALDRGAREPAVRVVLIHGGPQAFTSGNDLADFMNPAPAGDDRPVLSFLRAISSAPQPIVAAVDGPAVGVGTRMLLHCELVYAGESAFQLPFVNLGWYRRRVLACCSRPISAISARPSCYCWESPSLPRRHQYGIVTRSWPTVRRSLRRLRRPRSWPPVRRRPPA
jgi:hypothetical protein